MRPGGSARRRSIASGTAFPLALSWLLPALGIWHILLPWAAGGPAPDPVLLGSLAYAVAFVGWLSWAAAGGERPRRA